MIDRALSVLGVGLGVMLLALGIYLMFGEVRSGQKSRGGAFKLGNAFKDMFGMGVWLWAALGAALIYWSLA